MILGGGGDDRPALNAENPTGSISVVEASYQRSDGVNRSLFFSSRRLSQRTHDEGAQKRYERFARSQRESRTVIGVWESTQASAIPIPCRRSIVTPVTPASTETASPCA